MMSLVFSFVDFGFITSLVYKKTAFIKSMTTFFSKAMILVSFLMETSINLTILPLQLLLTTKKCLSSMSLDVFTSMVCSIWFSTKDLHSTTITQGYLWSLSVAKKLLSFLKIKFDLPPITLEVNAILFPKNLVIILIPFLFLFLLLLIQLSVGTTTKKVVFQSLPCWVSFLGPFLVFLL